jgi:hypothetical protein
VILLVSVTSYEQLDGRREGRRKVKRGEGGGKKDHMSSSSSPSVNKKLPYLRIMLNS